MRDEMAAGLLEDSVVTLNTLERVIEHVSSSRSSSSNGYQQIPLHFVLPSGSSSNYNSFLLFLQVFNYLTVFLFSIYNAVL